MKIAIFGSSGSGKSAVSAALANRLNIELRGCGDEVKKLAKSKGVSFVDLEAVDHLAVDSQTVEFAHLKNDWIIEGRFLDHVLRDFQKPFVLIRLEASATIRAGRLEKRDSRPTTTDHVRQYDTEDSQFRLKMYSGNPLQPKYIIECDQLSVIDVVNKILNYIKQTPQ